MTSGIAAIFERVLGEPRYLALAVLSVPLDLTDDVATLLLQTAGTGDSHVAPIKRLGVVRSHGDKWWVEPVLRYQLREALMLMRPELNRELHAVMATLDGHSPAHSAALLAYYRAPLDPAPLVAHRFEDTFYRIAGEHGLPGQALVADLSAEQNQWLGHRASDTRFYRAFVLWRSDRQAAVAIFEDILPRLVDRNRAVALHLAGRFYVDDDRTWGRAEDYLTSSVQLHRDLGLETGLYEAEASLSQLLQTRGFKERNKSEIEHALELARHANRIAIRTRDLRSFSDFLIAQALFYLGQPEESLPHFDAAYRFSGAEAQAASERAKILNFWAQALRDLQRIPEAIEVLEQIDILTGPIGRTIRTRVEKTWRSLMDSLLKLADTSTGEKQREALLQARQIAERIGDWRLPDIERRLSLDS